MLTCCSQHLLSNGNNVSGSRLDNPLRLYAAQPTHFTIVVLGGGGGGVTPDKLRFARLHRSIGLIASSDNFDGSSGTFVTVSRAFCVLIVLLSGRINLLNTGKVRRELIKVKLFLDIASLYVANQPDNVTPTLKINS
jgi:hypothetical protein